jgi:hypothetical protein
VRSFSNSRINQCLTRDAAYAIHVCRSQNIQFFIKKYILSRLELRR